METSSSENGGTASLSLDPPAPSRYLCSTCNFTFSSRSGLWEHNKKFHPDVAAAKARQPTLPCGLCSQVLFSQLNVCEHVSKEHGLPADIQEKHFSSVADFTTWKAIEESKANCFFSKKKTAAISSRSHVATEHYCCHRSGTFKPEGKNLRAPRQNVTNRTGFQCTAFIISKTHADGKVDVTCCLDHYGHDQLLNRTRLLASTREQVKSHLLDDRNFDWITKKMRESFQSADGITRSQLLNRADIFNIQRSCGLRKAEKHSDDMTSVAMWVEEHEGTEDNPFFCFHPLQEADSDFILGAYVSGKIQQFPDKSLDRCTKCEIHRLRKWIDHCQRDGQRLNTGWNQKN